MKREWKFLDNPATVNKLLYVFYASLLGLLISELFIHKHAYFPWEDAFGFFAVYGFVSCVALIFIAKAIRLIVKKEEDYYD